MGLTDFFRFPVVTVYPDETVFRAAELMRDHRVGCLVVTKEERPIGIITDRDVMTRVIVERKDPLYTQVRDVMSMNPVVAAEGLGVWEVIQLMKKNAMRRVPVVSGDGKLVGIVTLDDLVELMGTELAGIGGAIAAELGHKPAMSA